MIARPGQPNRSLQTDTPQTAVAPAEGRAGATAEHPRRNAVTRRVGAKDGRPAAAETLVPEVIPLIADRARVNIRNEYVSAPDHKALAISSGPIGFITAQAE